MRTRHSGCAAMAHPLSPLPTLSPPTHHLMHAPPVSCALTLRALSPSYVTDWGCRHTCMHAPPAHFTRPLPCLCDGLVGMQAHMHACTAGSLCAPLALRWPIRLVGVLLLLLLAFRYPWHAYAVTALGCAAAAVYIAPHLNLHPLLTRPVMGGLATMVCALCWLLPYTTAYLLGIGLWGLVLYASWQICLGASLLLLVFCYLPTLALCLVAAAAWLLFLLVLPRICLLLTELSVGCYFLSWYWPFVHVVLLCLLASGGDIKTLIPLAILCVVLFVRGRGATQPRTPLPLPLLWPRAAHTFVRGSLRRWLCSTFRESSSR